MGRLTMLIFANLLCPAIPLSRYYYTYMEFLSLYGLGAVYHCEALRAKGFGCGGLLYLAVYICVLYSV